MAAGVFPEVVETLRIGPGPAYAKVLEALLDARVELLQLPLPGRRDPGGTEVHKMRCPQGYSYSWVHQVVSVGDCRNTFILGVAEVHEKKVSAGVLLFLGAPKGLNKAVRMHTLFPLCFPADMFY